MHGEIKYLFFRKGMCPEVDREAEVKLLAVAVLELLVVNAYIGVIGCGEA